MVVQECSETSGWWKARQFSYSLYYQSKRNMKTHASKLQEGPMEDKEHKVIELKGSLKYTSRDTGQRGQRRCSQAALGSFHLPKQDNRLGRKTSQASERIKCRLIGNDSSISLEASVGFKLASFHT